MTASFPYECLEMVDSTNAYLKNRPDLWNKNFYTVHALKQTQGRGRYGRTWFSGHNNLTFSFIYNSPTPIDISPITIYAGLALRKALSCVTGVPILLKWPNDITFQGKKLGGILSEVVQSSDSKILIFGIGVNLNLDNMPDELVDKTISIKDITKQNLLPEIVLNSILLEMQKYLPSYKIPLSPSALSEFSENCDPNANLVSVYDNTTGKIIKKKVNITGINDQGLLCIVDENGKEDFINAHELDFN
jgi:BirA family biotin operon repressor/biotin-[acetyl-CoA-carboxylase] ligase